MRSPAEKKGKIKFKEFKTLSISENIFNEEILLDKNYYFTVSEPKRNIEWIDVFINIITIMKILNIKV